MPAVAIGYLCLPIGVAELWQKQPLGEVLWGLASHYVPSGNMTWYVVFLAPDGWYPRALDSVRADLDIRPPAAVTYRSRRCCRVDDFWS